MKFFFILTLISQVTQVPGPTNPFKIVCFWSFKTYKTLVSPAQGKQICNFRPSCSQFANEAVQQYGPCFGTLMGAERLLRCNGFVYSYLDKFYYGIRDGRIYDPPEDHFLPKYDHHIHHPDPDRTAR